MGTNVLHLGGLNQVVTIEIDVDIDDADYCREGVV